MRVVPEADLRLHLVLVAGEETRSDGRRGAVLLPAGAGVHHRGRGILAYALRHLRSHRHCQCHSAEILLTSVFLGLTFIAFTELVSVMYVYGHRRFTRDIAAMTGVTPGPFWQVTWRFVSPALMAAIILSSVYFMMSHWPTYTAWDRATGRGRRAPYPAWTLAIAALLATSSLAPILAGLLAQALRGRGGDQAKRFYRFVCINHPNTNNMK